MEGWGDWVAARAVRAVPNSRGMKPDHMCDSAAQCPASSALICARPGEKTKRGLYCKGGPGGFGDIEVHTNNYNLRRCTF